MKLKGKLVLLFSCVSLAITVTVGALLYYQLHKDRVLSVRTDTLAQLRHIAFSLNIFIDEVENDVRTLTQLNIVRSKNDSDFTNFTQADEKTFTYHIGTREQQIIDLFQTFRTTHPYVSSVYMGRENGNFVRSHKRERPTRYDPRNRPWYIQAMRSPERTVITDPYPSVTTQDINIGIVKALVDEVDQVYGVVGVDITLAKLTDYILNFRVGTESKILVVDRRGIVLASQDGGLLFSEIGAYSKDLKKILLDNDQSKNIVTIGKIKNYVYFQESPRIGWKVVVLIPAASIERQIRFPILFTTAGLIFGLILLSILSLFGLNVFVIRPLDRLSEEASLIAKTSDLDRQVPISSSDEIGTLASSFNEMIRALNANKKTLKKTEWDLLRHQEHLEDLVKERTEDLALARDKAQEADRVKSAFLAAMSHELRTPLNSIIGFTGILLQGLAGPVNEEQAKQLKMVRASSHHLLQLINEVLDISKIEAGQLTLEPSWFDIGQSIDSVVKLVQPLADTKGLAIRVETAPAANQIFHDQRGVKQILINLINNAIKFTEKGELCVQCELDPNHLTISVRDTGVGIKAEDMSILFETFRQIETGLTRRYEGTGLGLSISRGLVEMMGGQIWAESDGLGKGSVFRFTLPYKKEEVSER
jgi:signal transduction histidine kinase